VPRYAPGIYGIVTWYDQAVSMARSNDDGTFSAPKSTSFTRDIYPILKRADALRWVHRTAHGGAGPTALSDAARLAQLMNPAIRSAFVSRLTTLATDAGNPEVIAPNMPKLNSGANPDAGGPTWAHLSLVCSAMISAVKFGRGRGGQTGPCSLPIAWAFEPVSE